MEAVGQPPINGYFIAGSIIGPGGLNLVKELVQARVVACSLINMWMRGGRAWAGSSQPPPPQPHAQTRTHTRNLARTHACCRRLAPAYAQTPIDALQVQSVAQLGVQLLLFGLGLEFSLAKLRRCVCVCVLHMRVCGCVGWGGGNGGAPWLPKRRRFL